MSYYKLLFAVILLLLVLIFIFQNTQQVAIQFLIWEVSTARGIMVLLILLVGTLIGWLGRGQVASRRRG